MTDEIETIKAMYREYWRCMIAKDTGRLKEMMSEDYVLTHMTGVKQSREQFLKGLSDGTFHYYSADHGEIKAVIDGDRAVLSGTDRVRAAVYGGGKHSWLLKSTITLKKEDGVWLFAECTVSG